MNKDIFRSRKKTWPKFVLFFAVAALLLYGSFAFGYSTAKKGYDIGLNLTPKGVTNTELQKPQDVDFSLYWEAWKEVRSNYVGQTDPEEFLYGSISGLVNSLDDPYSVFLRPSERQDLIDGIEGDFEGIGVEVILNDGQLQVVAPLSDSPAQEAGLQPKDIIVSIDGEDVADMTFDEAISNIRGEEGTTVTLTIVRAGTSSPIEIDIVRQSIHVRSVSWEDRDYAGGTYMYIKIRNFAEDTEGLMDEVSSKITSGAYSGVILDLRNNPGGYFQTSIDVLDFFLSDKVAVSESRGEGQKKDYKTNTQAPLAEYPLAVLINGGSASASEIVAGALKDHQAGEIIGETSYGKGSVQVLEPLSDGSAIKITVAKWLTPDGSSINEVGITPEVEIADDLDTETDEVVDKSLQILTEGSTR